MKMFPTTVEVLEMLDRIPHDLVNDEDLKKEAADPTTSRARLLELSKHPNSFVVLAVVKNPNSPDITELLEM